MSTCLTPCNEELMTKRQVESRELRVQARLNYGEFEICDMNGEVYHIDVKDNGQMWHRRLSREAPNCTWEFYRNEFDVIEESQVDVTFRTRELLITNPEVSYLEVKKEILKLQEDTFNKLRIKIPEYEQPSIPSGAEYTPGESSGGPNTWAYPWTSEQWPNVYDAQSRGISQMDLQMSQWTQDFCVLDALTPVRVLTPPPHIIEGVHIYDQGTQLTPHMEEEGEDNDETQPLRRMIGGGKSAKAKPICKSACSWPTSFLEGQHGKANARPLPGSKSAKGRPICKLACPWPTFFLGELATPAPFP
ncbi:hypothetical protein Taro_037929 [Colocasia esculenta]|uniref:Uncharacterized protein n=1 Tax=Colocasia esculenta TaxID=4460 RepID=A0A843W5D2_COLES|nr:hypothetical protein [Colocasia esculenta]